jgi:predicted TIM-barrel fold metal-dependent hydrolase
LDRLHVDAAVLADACTARTGDVRESNEHALVAVRTHPGRFIAFANIRLGPEPRAALDELQRTVGAGGFRGISLDPALDQIPANSPLIHPLIEAAVQYDVPVRIATGAYPYATPTLVGGLAASFPHAKIICGNLGGDLFYDAIATGRRHPSLYFDIAGQGRASFQEALRELGASRLIYASGFPRLGAAITKVVVERTRMPAAGRARILGGNMADLLGATAIKELEQWAGQTPAFA